MELDHYKAAPSLQDFFKNLFDLKEFIREESVKKNDKSLEDIYKRLDSIIKKGK